MAFEIQRRIPVRQIQTQKRNIPLDQIIAIEGQNPVAKGVETLGNVLGTALQQRADLRRQGEQLAKMEALAGKEAGSFQGLDPANAATFTSQLLKEPEYVIPQQDATGQITGFLNVPKGMKPTAFAKPPGTSTQARNLTQTSYVDSVDGVPILLDKNTRSYIRSDNGGAILGKAVPSKGQAEAVQSTSRAQVILPKIDTLFDSLAQKSELGARAAVIPGISKAFFPEINQLKNEVKQIGFTFGGKNFTGTEEQIIMDALIPNSFDNDASREAKREALKGYISGQTDLLQTANLLGPAGNRIKQVIGSQSGLKTLSTPAPSSFPTQNSKDAIRKKLGL